MATVEVNGASGKVNVEKKHSATFDLAGTSSLHPRQQSRARSLRRLGQAAGQISPAVPRRNSYSPYGYGASDLNYYGSFYNIPGYGMMWQPYLVGAGWDPFMNGAWTWYPGAGYAWVSATRGAGRRIVTVPGLRQLLWMVLAAGNIWSGWNTVPRIVNRSTALQRAQNARHAGTNFDRQPGRARRGKRRDPGPGDREYAAIRQAWEWREAVSAIWEGSRSRWSGQHPRPASRIRARHRACPICALPRHDCPLGGALQGHCAREQHRRSPDEQWIGILGSSSHGPSH